MELYLGDTEHDGDLECLLLFLFELNLELNPRETERDRDLLLFVFEVTFDRILGDLDLFRYRDRDLLLLGDGL